jgi:hypothetical protein
MVARRVAEPLSTVVTASLNFSAAIFTTAPAPLLKKKRRASFRSPPSVPRRTQSPFSVS